MTDHHRRVMEGNWNSTEVWPVPVECLLNGAMGNSESQLMFGGNHLLPPHFRHRFQAPVCLSTAHLGPGALNQINVSIPTHSLVEGNQVSVDNSANSAERNDVDSHSISQPMTMDNDDVLEETDEASDEEDEDEADGEEEVTVPMSLVHEQQQQQHGQSVTMSIDSDPLSQCQQQQQREPLQVNGLQGDPMQQQGAMMSTIEQCQHQKSALVSNGLGHAHPPSNSSLEQQLPHGHAHPLAGNAMIAEPLSLPLQQQQQQPPPSAFANNAMPPPNESNSQGSSDPNLGYTVQGKMYYEGRVVLHLKQLRTSFGGMNGPFHTSNGFSSCAEAELSKNNNLMGCAICRLRNPDAQSSQRQKEAHRHSVKGVLFTFEDCLIVELYPDHIPINTNPLDVKGGPGAAEPQKPSQPMPISSYLNTQQPPPHAPSNGKRMMSHQGMEDEMDPLCAVIVANKQHPTAHQQHQHQPQPQAHELQQQQAPNTEESSWWDDFESEDELKRTEGAEGHGHERAMVTMKLSAEQHHNNPALHHLHSQPQPGRNEGSGPGAGMLSHELLEPHSCMANDVVSLSQPPPIHSDLNQSIVPLEIELSGAESVGMSEDSSSHSVGLSSQQPCVELEEGECEEEEPQMVVVELVGEPRPEVSRGRDYDVHHSNSPAPSTTKYPCPVCRHSFHLKKMLKCHLEEMHHSGNPYRCLQCEAQFADERRLKKHSCTLSVQTLKSRERKFSFVSVFDQNCGGSGKKRQLVSGSSGHSEEESESEEDFFEDSLIVSDIEEENGSSRTRDNSSEEDEDEGSEDDDQFPHLQIVAPPKRGNSKMAPATKAKKSKSEGRGGDYLDGRVRIPPQVFQDDEDEASDDDYEDENENSQDENEYELESQCVEEEAKEVEVKNSPPTAVAAREKKKELIRVSLPRSKSFKISGSGVNSKKKSKKGGKPFNCGICGKGFSIERRLENHKASHATERYSQCEKCGKRFARKDKLMRHMYVHSEEKMFVCDICQKRFSRRDKLSDHLKSHGTEEVHNCPMCQKQFLRPDILKQHVKLHGMGNKHQCPECLRFVTGKERLEKHMARHEEAKALGQTLLCPLCTKYFIQRQSLKAHIKKFHPEALKILNFEQNVTPSTNSVAKTPKSSRPSSAHPSVAPAGRGNKALLLQEMGGASKAAPKENRAFACQYCPRLFVRKLALKKHLRKHPQIQLKLREEPTESEQCSEEEEAEGLACAQTEVKPCPGGASTGCTTHDIQSIISAPNNSRSIPSAPNISSTPPVTLLQIASPVAPQSPHTPPLHHQLPLSSTSITSISCNGGAEIVSHLPLPQSMANVAQGNAEGILESAATEMSQFAVASHQHAAAMAAAHQHHAHQHIHSPHANFSAAAHSFLSACAVSSSLHQQTATTSAVSQPTNADPAQLPPSPNSGQLLPHLSQQLSVPLQQHHVNVSMAPAQSMCASSYLLAAYPHYSYQ